MPLLFDRVKESSATTGTGAFALGGAEVGGYQAFGSVLSNGQTCYYCAQNTAAGQYEVGIGTYNSGPNTLARTTVLASSNSNALVNFSPGGLDVFIPVPASRIVTNDNANTFSTGPQICKPGADGNKALIAKGNSLTQSANLFEVQQSNGTVLVSVGPTGVVGLSAGTSPAGQLHVKSGTASTVGVVIQLASTPTADGWQLQNSSGTVLARFDSLGTLGIGTAPPGTADVQIRVGTSSTASYDIGRSTSSGLLQFTGNQTDIAGYHFSSGSTNLCQINNDGSVRAANDVCVGNAGNGGRLYLLGNSTSLHPVYLERNSGTGHAMLQLQDNFAGGDFIINAGNAGTIPLRAQGAASQTADLFRAETSGAALQFALDARGNIKTANASAATTPGSVVQKLPIYNASGTLLGYIPIYNSIT